MNKEIALCLKRNLPNACIHMYMQKRGRGRQWDTETIELSSLAKQIL